MQIEVRCRKRGCNVREEEHSTVSNSIIPGTINALPVTSIGLEAFQITSPKSVTVPNSVTNIGDYAFSDCGNLTNLTILDGAARIGSGRFWLREPGERGPGQKPHQHRAGGIRWCTSLGSITLPDTVTNIEDGVQTTILALLSLRLTHCC